MSVGDKVKYVSGRFGDCAYNPLWGGSCGRVVGTVSNKHSLHIQVMWNNGKRNSYEKSDLQLIKPKAGHPLTDFFKRTAQTAHLTK
jgi:hypothetical protein